MSMTGVTEIRLVVETSDPEVEKRILNLLEADEIDWDNLQYLLEFADNFTFTHTHKRKGSHVKGKRRSGRTRKSPLLGSKQD